MSHVALRCVQVLFWGVVCLLLAPSKATAVAYGIVILGLLISVIIILIGTRVIISAIRKVFAKPPRG